MAESNTMKALQVVMGHIGTRNVKKLKRMIDKTEELEIKETFESNMKTWLLASQETLVIVADTLEYLKMQHVDPYDETS